MDKKIKFIILTLFILQISEKLCAQITLKKGHISVKNFVKQIEKQTSYIFLIKDDFDVHTRVKVDLHDADIKDALRESLDGSGISFDIVGHNILLKKEQPTLTDWLRSLFSPKPGIKFKVIDEEGQVLVGATLKKLNSAGVFRNNDEGFFYLQDLEPNAELEVSYIGYKTARFRAKNIGSYLTLSKATTDLEEVIVNKGYYTIKQRLNTGSTIQVSSKNLENQPLANPISSLTGLIPGMYIEQSSGAAGAVNNVQIRGRSSINSGLAPLYILDGVPFLSTPVDKQIGSGAPLMGSQPNGSTDPMTVINPADIESITIFKDADATAIYGSRGSNGVVLITTKRAKAGQSGLDVKLQRGYSHVVNQLELLSLEEYLDLRRRAFQSDNRIPTAASAPDLMLWDQTKSTDIQNILIGNTSRTTDFTTSVSAGTAKSSFFLSGSYHDEGSILLGGRGFRRGTMVISGATTSANNKLMIAIGGNLSFGKNKMPGADFTSNLYRIPQNFPLYDPNGGINWVRSLDNPISASRQLFQSANSNFNIHSNLSYRITDELSFKASSGYNRIEQTQSFQAGASTVNPLASPPISSALYSSANTATIVTESQLDFSKTINKHSLALSTGGSWQETHFKIPYLIAAQSFASEALLGDFTNAANISAVKALAADYKYLSFFGRANYSYAEKYVINATIRRDGSSRFGPEKRFGNFGSIGAAWIFSEEPFIKRTGILDFGKLRGSFGITGNDQIDNYGYSDTYTITSSNYGGQPGFYPSRIANPRYGWETTKKIELAMELAFLHNRIRATPAVFRSRTGNMILRDIPIPAQSGFTTYTANLDAIVSNYGFEFEISAKVIESKMLKWDIGLNVTQSKNKLLSLPPSLVSLYADNYQVSQPVNTNIAYHFTGFANGIAQFEDRNGDGIITPSLSGDYYIIGQREPSYYGGLSTVINFKRFRVDILLNFATQKAIRPMAYPGAFGAQLSSLKTSSFIPSTLTSSASYASYLKYLASDAVFRDASFMRLRNLSLSYSIKDKWLRKFKMSHAELFLKGQNILTLTKYEGLDPETKNRVLPPLKTFLAGLSCSF